MARADILNVLYSQNKSPLEFKFDSLFIPPMLNYITPEDIYNLYRIATSKSISSKINEKYKLISEIMLRRGFKKLGCGTNRMVFCHLEDHRFVAKVALDDVGMTDNPREFQNQRILRPFVTKAFEVSPCGTVGFFERVDPITNNKEFEYAASDIFNLLVNFIIGKYILEDIGNKFFMNWGIRKGFGPCLLDYPYVYELDGNKMFCNAPITPGTKFPVCGGEIDYDIGFNKLLCTKCGKQYFAKGISKMREENLILIKGDVTMKTRIIGPSGKVLYASNSTTEYIKPEAPKKGGPKTKRPKYPSMKLTRESDMVAQRLMGKPDFNKAPEAVKQFIQQNQVKQTPDFANMTVGDAIRATAMATAMENKVLEQETPKVVEPPKTIVEVIAQQPTVQDYSPFVDPKPVVELQDPKENEEIKAVIKEEVYNILDAYVVNDFDFDKYPIAEQRDQMFKMIMLKLIELEDKVNLLGETREFVANSFIDKYYVFEAEPVQKQEVMELTPVVEQEPVTEQPVVEQEPEPVDPELARLMAPIDYSRYEKLETAQVNTVSNDTADQKEEYAKRYAYLEDQSEEEERRIARKNRINDEF